MYIKTLFLYSSSPCPLLCSTIVILITYLYIISQKAPCIIITFHKCLEWDRRIKTKNIFILSYIYLCSYFYWYSFISSYGFSYCLVNSTTECKETGLKKQSLTIPISQQLLFLNFFISINWIIIYHHHQCSSSVYQLFSFKMPVSILYRYTGFKCSVCLQTHMRHWDWWLVVNSYFIQTFSKTRVNASFRVMLKSWREKILSSNIIKLFPRQ